MASVSPVTWSHQHAGGAVGEFNALQDVITAQMLRARATGEQIEFAPLWEWYVDQLLRLHEEVQLQLERRGIPYRIERYDTLKITQGRIRSILDTIPGIVGEETPAKS